MQTYKNRRKPARSGGVSRRQSSFFAKALLLAGFFLLSAYISPPDSAWVPYTTQRHIEMGNNLKLSERISRYLIQEKHLEGPALKSEFQRWFITNLGHVFEDAALRSYRVGKNTHMYNCRIPDGVEDGMLEQLSQYTHYHASTFIEVKFKRIVSLQEEPVASQLKEMIDYLGQQVEQNTWPRHIGSIITREPGTAAEEELAVLLLITPANATIGTDVIAYAAQQQVKVYQAKMKARITNLEFIKLDQLEALTEPSRHFHAHLTASKEVKVNWQLPIIDPDTGFPVSGY